MVAKPATPTLPALGTLHAIKLWLGSTAKIMVFLALFALTGHLTASELEVGQRFRDCPECPEMVVVPSGSFLMGAPESEEDSQDDERPVHRVAVQSFAVGVYEVTVAEFSSFVDETDYSTSDFCSTWEWITRGCPSLPSDYSTSDACKVYVHRDYVAEEWDGFGWRNPGFEQDGSHPVVCVSWHDARAYVNWLSRRTGERYRLLSEAEWEYMARAGTRTAQHWGKEGADQCEYANGADASAGFYWGIDCDDGHSRTASVGSYRANAWGLHDVLGNVFEWTADCWNKTYAGAPSDGGAWKSGNCSAHVLRGGSWSLEPGYLRSAHRNRISSGNRISYLGFRVARTLTP